MIRQYVERFNAWKGESKLRCECHQLGGLAHSCDSAAGELELWIAVGWDPPDEAGHVELVSALSLVSTWVPPGSRR